MEMEKKNKICHVFSCFPLVGHTVAILSSICTVLMVAAQYTILKHILPGNQNWQELLGVAMVILGSMCPTVYDIVMT